MKRWLANAGVVVAMALLGGCPADSIGYLSTTIDTHDLTLGHQGGDGVLSYIAVGVESGESSGECREAKCVKTFDDLKKANRAAY